MFCDRDIQGANAKQEEPRPMTMTPFTSWLEGQMAAGVTGVGILKSIGANVQAGHGEEDVCKSLQAFATDPQVGPKACEVVRKMCLQLQMQPPFPFSLWLRERKVNGATAEQVLHVLQLPLQKDSILSEEERWQGLWKLADEDEAWTILASMAEAPKLIEAPPRAVRAVVERSEEVAQLISSSSRILVLTGAGISASSGIPTFRDEGGFYADVAKEFGLKSPEELSDINFFRQNPRPWFKKMSAIVPNTRSRRKPSLTHRFIRMLEDHGKLLHLFTQNIDTLEKIAGITRVTFCHGSFATATCMSCGHAADGAKINDTIAKGEIPLCADCNGIMKPDVILFNEPMPSGVREKIAEFVESADLLLVIGTSLNVTPCSLIPSLVGASGEAPRILINKEVAGKDSDFEGFLEGQCDDIVSELLKYLRWSPAEEELMPLVN